jgi:general secretion pathway protein G
LTWLSLWRARIRARATLARSRATRPRLLGASRWHAPRNRGEEEAMMFEPSRRSRARGVTLVEVLIVVAIMSVIAGMVTLVAFPELKRARIRTAALSGKAVRQAAELYREVDLGGDRSSCPTVENLAAARRLDAKASGDPWGSRFHVECVEEDDLRAISPGSDRRLRTPDDVRDDVSPAEIEAISRL